MARSLRRPETVLIGMKTQRVGGATVFTSAKFGSQNESYRISIREALQAELGNEYRKLGRTLNPADLHNLGDLSRPPRIDEWGISVSHCPKIGGFALVSGTQALGLDFEVPSRMTEAVVRRIAASDGEKKILAALVSERSNAKDRAQNLTYFWCAKEASIKALGNRLTDRAIQLGDVEIVAIDSNRKTFAARSTLAERQITVAGLFFDVLSNDAAAPSDGDLVGALATIDCLKSGQ